MINIYIKFPLKWLVLVKAQGQTTLSTTENSKFVEKGTKFMKIRFLSVDQTNVIGS